MMLQRMTGPRPVGLVRFPEAPLTRASKALLSQKYYPAKPAQCHAARKKFGLDSVDLRSPYERLLDEVLNQEQEREIDNEECSLPVDLEEQPYKYLFIANVPGMDKSDLKLSVNTKEKTMTIVGGRQRSAIADTVKGQKKLHNKSQGPVPKFQRVLTDLPEDADLSTIKARVAKGVLTIKLKKKKTTGDKTITISHDSDEEDSDGDEDSDEDDSDEGYFSDEEY